MYQVWNWWAFPFPRYGRFSVTASSDRVTLTFDLSTSECGYVLPVSWAFFLPIFSFLRPSIVDLGSGACTDRQTYHQRFMTLLYEGGSITRISANADKPRDAVAWLTPKTCPCPICYHAEFDGSDSMSKGVDLGVCRVYPLNLYFFLRLKISTRMTVLYLSRMSEKQEFRFCVPAELVRRFKGLCIDAGKLCTCVNYLSGSARVLACEKGVLLVSCDPLFMLTLLEKWPLKRCVFGGGVHCVCLHTNLCGKRPETHANTGKLRL